MNPPLKIFISSPGDVGQERVLARRVLARLQGEFGRSVTLEPILWEHEPLRATSHFQEQIIPPSSTEIVVCILWSRLGTRLPEQFRRPDGSHYSSGTEWEFEDAAASHRERGKPQLLVYRKMAESHASLSDEKALMGRLEQKRALHSFLDRWFGNPETTFRRAFHAFNTLDEFERILETHLRHLIQDHLQGPTGPGPRTWYGNPYRGLEVFEMNHAPIFCGRTKAIGEIRQALMRQAAEGCAFLLVFGMSGCGKSSLVRAGLLSDLTQPGVIEGIGLWRWCLFRPGDAAGDLFEGLALSLLRKESLPEMESMGSSAGELATLLRDSPLGAVALIGVALNRAAALVAEEEKLEAPPEARLAVVIDQMEELFTLDRVDGASRSRFAATLAALARSGRVWVIGTMRSDFYHRLAEIPELVALAEGQGQYHLLAPTPAETRQMIGYPAQAAGLRFEVNPASQEGLDDVIHDAAVASRAVLPLLEFILTALYETCHADGMLSFAAYQQLGGLEGALAKRAEEVLTALRPAVQATLPSLLRALVTVGHEDPNLVASGSGLAGDLPPFARRAPLADLGRTEELRSLLDAFIQARLLVTDRADNGEAVVGVAHEALLRHWPRVQEWLAEDREFLRTRERVETAAQRWREEALSQDLLLPEGKPLVEAHDLLSKRGADLHPHLVEYIKASVNWKARLKAKKARTIAAITGAFFLLLLSFGLVSAYQLRQLEGQREQTVETIAQLVDVPQTLQGLNDADSVKILDAILQATQKTLRKAADTQATQRAKAVTLLLQTEKLRRGKELDPALRSFQEVLRMGTALVEKGGKSVDQRNMAVFSITGGMILEALGEKNGSPEDPHFEEALASYARSGEYAQRAIKMRDTEAPRVLWYSLMMRADLALRLLRFDEAAKTGLLGLQLLQERGAPPQDRRSSLDLAHNQKLLGRIRQEQGNSFEETGDLPRARQCWREALASYEKCLQTLAPRGQETTAENPVPDDQVRALMSEVRALIGQTRKKLG